MKCYIRTIACLYAVSPTMLYAQDISANASFVPTATHMSSVTSFEQAIIPDRFALSTDNGDNALAIQRAADFACASQNTNKIGPLGSSYSLKLTIFWPRYPQNALYIFQVWKVIRLLLGITFLRQTTKKRVENAIYPHMLEPGSFGKLLHFQHLILTLREPVAQKSTIWVFMKHISISQLQQTNRGLHKMAITT